MPKFQEFFAGGGMVRAGLGVGWTCLFANDISAAKGKSYQANWGEDHFTLCDIRKLSADDLGGQADLSWASFPCQDLSLAGIGAGLSGTRSDTFRVYWQLVQNQVNLGCAPKIVVLENVMGAMTSHKGKDFEALCLAYSGAGYRFGAFSIDAVHFVPQSRKRLFFVGVRDGFPIAPELEDSQPNLAIHPKTIVNAQSQLPDSAQEKWVWWQLPKFPTARCDLKSVIQEVADQSVKWNSKDQTERLISLMDTNNKVKLKNAMLSPTLSVGTLYRRMRKDAEGNSVQRAEIRFDGVSGCLRVPIGGSSKQTLFFVEGNRIQSRLMTAKETAALMGLSKEYQLPNSATECLHLTGDGVVVPLVSFLREHLFEKLLQTQFLSNAHFAENSILKARFNDEAHQAAVTERTTAITDQNILLERSLSGRLLL